MADGAEDERPRRSQAATAHDEQTRAQRLLGEHGGRRSFSDDLGDLEAGMMICHPRDRSTRLVGSVVAHDDAAGGHVLGGGPGPHLREVTHRRTSSDEPQLGVERCRA
jgi:hypothetical protein